MRDINNHVHKYLDYYIGLAINPGYAVLLHGEWGCGKTWFIKNYIKNDVSKTDGDNPYLYISLYGVNSFSEIDDQIFQQLHPILSSKAMALTGKILKGILRTSLKIDLDRDNKSDGSINSSIPDIDLPDYLKNTENRILVFDDLERSCLSIKKLLGYINTFVEHQGLKVIILANEEEIKTNENEYSIYKRIKEKIIGKSYKINIDFDSAFNSFSENIADVDTKRLLENNKSTVVEVFTLGNYGNLRHLQQSFWDFERFFKNVNGEFKKSVDLTKELLSLFLAFSIEIKGGKLSASDINQLSSINLLKLSRREENDKSNVTPIEKVVNKYGFINYYDPILTQSSWSMFFEKGFLSEEDITQCLEKSRYFQDDNTPDWRKLWHYYELEDNAFEQLFEKVRKQWDERAFLNPGEILHVYGLFLRFSQIGLYSATYKDIVNDCKKYIREIVDKDVFKDVVRTHIDRDSWNGLGYFSLEMPEFREILEFLIDKIDEAKISTLPKSGQNLLRIMSDDTDMFIRMITQNNSADEIYYDIPIFSYIDAKDFVSSYLLLESPKKRVVALAVGDRYVHPHIAKQLLNEIDFLKKVSRLLGKEIKIRNKKLSGHVLEAFIEKTVNKSIKILESIKEKDSQDAQSSANNALQ